MHMPISTSPERCKGKGRRCQKALKNGIAVCPEKAGQTACAESTFELMTIGEWIERRLTLPYGARTRDLQPG